MNFKSGNNVTHNLTKFQDLGDNSQSSFHFCQLGGKVARLHSPWAMTKALTDVNQAIELLVPDSSGYLTETGVGVEPLKSTCNKGLTWGLNIFLK